MITSLRKIVNELTLEDLENTHIIAERLLKIISHGCEITKQRRFNCDMYVELLLFINIINKELIERKRLK